MRRCALVVLVLLAGACVVWLVGSPWGEGATGTVATSDGTRASEGATLSQPGASTEAASTALPPASLRGAPPAERPLAKDEGGLYGVVLDARTGALVPGVTVHVLRLDWYHGNFALLGSATSDAAGRYRLRGLEKSWEDTGVLGVGGGWVTDVERIAVLPDEDTLPAPMRFEIVQGAWIPFDVRVRPAVRVEGTVSLPDGTPAAGACVRLDAVPRWGRFPWDVLPPAPCDERGRFALTAVEKQLTVAHLDGYVDVTTRVPKLAPDSTASLDVVLPAPHRALVQVVDRADGSVVEGAEVRFEWQRPGPDDESAEVLVPVTTDARGRAALAPVPPEGIRIKARRDGYLPFGWCEEDAWGDVLEETEPGLWTATAALVPLVRVEGRVAWPPGGDLPPVAFLRSKGPTRHLNSDFDSYTDVEPDGTFRLLLPPDGTHRLSFFANDDGDLWGAAADVEAGATDVVLRPVMTKRREVVDRSRWGLWRLTLRDTQGRPLASAEIDREGPARSEVSPCDPDEKLEEGRVEVQVAPGAAAAWLRVWLARTVDDEPLGSLLVGPLGPEGGVRDVMFPEPRTVTGRVLAPDGTPLQGVEVWAMPVTRFDSVYWHDDTALTDADGRFVLRDLLQPAYEVAVRPTGTWVLPAALRADAGATGLVLRLIAPVTSRLTVRDGRGRAMADARVVLWQRDGVAGPDADQDGIFLWTDAAGEVVVEGLEAGGLYDLRVEAPSDRPDLLEHVAQGWTPHDELVVLREGLTVKGVVRGAAGRPMARVEVWLEHPGGRRETTESDGIGRFTFRSVAPGEVRLAACFLEAREEGWAPDLDVGALAGDEGVELRLDSKRDLHVRVEIPDDVTLGMKTIDLTPAEDGAPGARKRVSISPQGAALFRGLEPGLHYRLWGGPTGTGGYVLAEIDAEQTSVLAPLAEGGEIEGRLLLPPGAEQTGVRIVKRGVHCQAQPLPGGTFRLVGVPPGTWTLEAWCHVDGERRFVRQTAQAGDETTFDLTTP